MVQALGVSVERLVRSADSVSVALCSTFSIVILHGSMDKTCAVKSTLNAMYDIQGQVHVPVAHMS